MAWLIQQCDLSFFFVFSILFCIYLQKQDNNKKPNYVQISVESYSHLSDLEDQVKTYEEKVQTLEDEIKEMNEKMSAANSEINTKESMVKQHAKVAEEAVSGKILNEFTYHLKHVQGWKPALPQIASHYSWN